jgi:hypothetical protein
MLLCGLGLSRPVLSRFLIIDSAHNNGGSHEIAGDEATENGQHGGSLK